MPTKTTPSSTSKVRRDIVGGKRPPRRRDRIRRPDPTRIGLGATDESRTSIAGLAQFATFLRPGDRAFGTEDLETVRKVVRRTSAQVHARQRLWVRIDAAGDDASLFRMFQQERVLFVTKPRLTPNLVGGGVEDRGVAGRRLGCVRRAHHGGGRRSFERPGCSEAGVHVRVIAVRTREQRAGRQLYMWDGLDWTVKLYLTNSDDPAEEIARRYEGRAGIEPLIAEWKNGWGIGEAPCWAFDANHAALLLKLLAHNLMRGFVRARRRT